MWFRGILNPNIWRVSPGLAWVAPKERFDSSMARLWFESTALHKMLYQPSSRLSGLVSDCTGISVKGLGLALACFSDVGRDGMDASMPLHGVSIVPKSSASLDYSTNFGAVSQFYKDLLQKSL